MRRLKRRARYVSLEFEIFIRDLYSKKVPTFKLVSIIRFGSVNGAIDGRDGKRDCGQPRAPRQSASRERERTAHDRSERTSPVPNGSSCKLCRRRAPSTAASAHRNVSSQRILTARAAQGGLIPEPPAMWLASGNVRNVDVDMNVKLARSYCGRQVAGACRPDTWECRPSVRVPAVSVRLVPIVIRHQTYPPARGMS